MMTTRWKRQVQLESTPAIQNQPQQQAHYSSAASSSGHGFVSFSEAGPARVDVLTANNEEQEYHRRTRRGGQNQRDAVARQNREANRGFLSWLEKLEQGLQRRPAPVPREVGLGSRWRNAHHFSHLGTLTRHRYQLSLKALNRQRDQLRKNVLFSSMPCQSNRCTRE